MTEKETKWTLNQVMPNFKFIQLNSEIYKDMSKRL